ncbi:unnamed protein product [Paramecium pentaurelia]|uniref:Uncharacterized protein n=1 Tax=Paramecium pentaurelia TaxID=43138 RepID=A0A8S1Y9X4_9CILI|nr:unnamed protein product [Paramecium pentaurelia]
MDQQISYFQTQQFLEPNQDPHKSQRSKSNTRDLLTSPNIVYVTRTIQQQNTQPPIRLETQQLKPSSSQYNIKVQDIVKVMEPSREELEFYKNKCSLYEKQIQELTNEIHRLKSTCQEKVTYIEDTHRIQQLETNLQQYQIELNRVNTLLRETTNESEQLKIKVTQMNQQFMAFQQHQVEYERIKKSSQDNEQYWQNEIQRLNVLVSQSQSQLQQMQKTLIETKKYEQSYMQQQQVQGQLTTELERITILLKQKSEEYDQSKQTYIKEIEILSKRLRESELEIQDLKNREINYKQNIDNQLRENQNLQDKYMNEMLNKNEEISKLQSIIQTLQMTLQDTSKYQEYEIRSKLQNEEINNLNQRIRIKQDELDKYKQQLMFYQNQLQEYQKYTDYEIKYQNLAQEFDRVNNSLMIKLQENDQLRNCISKLQITLNDHYKVEDYENKIGLQNQEIDRLHQSLQHKVEEIDRLTNEYNRMSSQLRQKNDELENFKYKLQDITQLKEYQQKFTLLSTEIERLTMQLRSKNEEIEKIRLQFSQFQLSEANKLKELEQKNVVYSNEIERLSNLLKIKLQEIESNKMNIKQLQEECDSQKIKLITQMDVTTYNEKITQLSQEVDSWKIQFINLNREYHKQQEQLILSNAELDTFKKQKNGSFKVESYEIVKENQNSKISSYQYGTLANRNL